MGKKKEKNIDDHDEIILEQTNDLIEMLGYARQSKKMDDPLYQEFLNKYIVPIFGDPDEHGNFIYIVTNKTDMPSVAYMAHHDTVHRGCYRQDKFLEYELTYPADKVSAMPSKKRRAVELSVRQPEMLEFDVVETMNLKGTKKKHGPAKHTTRKMVDPNVNASNCLGADCTTGIWLILEMIAADCPGVYVIHADEEVGRIGSEAIVKDYNDVKGYDWIEDIDICISFDRKDVNSIITFQSGKRCCSEAFSESLSSLLSPDLEAQGYPVLKSDDGGSFTDSYSYMGVIPECTNLSVGYFRQHTSGEYQDLKFAMILRDSLIKNASKIDDRKTIAVERNHLAPPESKYKQSNYGYGSYNNHGKGTTTSQVTNLTPKSDKPANPNKLIERKPDTIIDLPDKNLPAVDYTDDDNWGWASWDQDNYMSDYQGVQKSSSNNQAIEDLMLSFTMMAAMNFVPDNKFESEMVLAKLMEQYPYGVADFLMSFGLTHTDIIEHIYTEYAPKGA